MLQCMPDLTNGSEHTLLMILLMTFQYLSEPYLKEDVIALNSVVATHLMCFNFWRSVSSQSLSIC